RTLLGATQKIPHIGWSALQASNEADDWQKTLLQDNRLGEAVYFVHSFMAVPKNASHRIADCLYGGHRIAAMISRGHITGCQFHPEKSGEVGLKILRRFCAD
ncbi:MAG TPA: imidazole glycerol phosphate synthase subunit HisH, partial [Porticoccaceae bacterium]|nr:imidazole glycerol phosphate synthase subunit HisH [Porticoccaceae bacterium]